MVLPFDTDMVGGVEVKHHQLLPEGYGGEKLSEGVFGLGCGGGASVEEDGEGGVD